VEVVNSIPPDKQIIFVPDQHLGRFVAERTGRNLVLWPGYCTTHIFITEEDIKSARAKYPDAIVMAHPECSEAVKDIADELLSTGQMLEFVRKSPAKRFIVVTEAGMIYSLKKQNSEAEFITASNRAICPNMKKITLEKVAWSLEDMQYKVTVPEEMRIKAKKALDRMVEILPSKVGKD
jgi:quinolinate synthase